jgi:serine/threonine protein kinase
MGLTTQNYDILTRLAVGNGALVYQAMDKVSHRQVALKLLVQDGNVDHRFNVDALLADSQRLRQITGTHVCQLLDAYRDDDGPVLAYEFAKGVSGTELPQQRMLDAAQASDVAAQLISALRSGERQKCPHGDVKPSNIIFMELADKRPFTLVLDWGLTAYRSVTSDDSMPYLAPERLAGAAASHSADLFSAGALLFFLCTGKTLVAGTNRTELSAAWRQVRPAVLAELRPDLPAKFVQWLCSLLELAPEQRPASAVDAFASLAALNPPPPPVPPESFRPKPVSKIAALPIASGIVKRPPEMQAKPVSAIRQPPPPAASPPAPAKQAAASGPGPVTQSHVAMTVGLFTFLVALIAGSVWFFFFRNTETKYPGDEAAVRPASTVAARTPAPSIGENIGKKITPPPMPPKPAVKSGESPKPKPKATPTPKPPAKPATPKPAIPAANPQPSQPPPK